MKLPIRSEESDPSPPIRSTVVNLRDYKLLFSLPLILIISDPNIAREFAHRKDDLMATFGHEKEIEVYILEGSPGIVRVIHRKRRTQRPFGGRIQLLPPDAAEPIPLRKEIEQISVR